MTTRLALWLLAGVLLAAPAMAGQNAPVTYAGRPLADALRDLQGQGLKVVFSSELVKPELRVRSAPRATTPRRVLDEILKPHGLEVRTGAGGTLIVVRSRPATNPPRRIAVASGTISGHVVDASTGKPIGGVEVAIQATAQSARTSDDGTFSIPDVEPGHYALFVSTIGYALARPEVDVTEGASVTLTIPLSEGTGAYTERITVTADSTNVPSAAVSVQETLGSAGLQSVRGVFVDDPFRAVQGLPGVAANDDFRSDFSVRGMSFHRLGLSIDGVSTPWLLHAFEEVGDSGSMAVLNSDILDRMTLSVGAYPQRYADRTGAWLETTMREGSRSATTVRGALSGTNASLLAEGPVGADAGGSWLVSIRRSYVDWLVRRVVPEFNAVFGFTDLQSKVVYDLTAHHQVQVTAVGGRARLLASESTTANDVLNAADDLALGTVALRSVLTPSLLVTQRASVVTQTFSNINPFNTEIAHGSDRGASYRATATWTPHSQILIESGAQYDHRRASRKVHEYSFLGGPGPTLLGIGGFAGSDNVAAGYVHGSLTLRRMSAGAGARVSHSSASKRQFVSPWTQVAVPLAAAMTLRASAGVSHQFPDFDQLFGAHAGFALGPERARHVDVGLEHRLSSSLRWQITAYHREEDGFLERRQALFRLADGRILFPDPNSRWENALNGRSHGVELTVHRNQTQGLSGWASYGYGHTRYQDALTGDAFDGPFDQRHTVNVFAQYAVSNRTSFSSKWRYGSNYPVPGYWTRAPGRLLVSDRRNEVRVPAYSRLDVRANRVYNYTKRRLTLFVEVMNVLNHTNARAVAPAVFSHPGQVFAVDYVQNLFPLLPSAGLLIEF